jgi:hypothetical protein
MIFTIRNHFVGVKKTWTNHNIVIFSCDVFVSVEAITLVVSVNSFITLRVLIQLSRHTVRGSKQQRFDSQNFDHGLGDAIYQSWVKGFASSLGLTLSERHTFSINLIWWVICLWVPWVKWTCDQVWLLYFTPWRLMMRWLYIAKVMSWTLTQSNVLSWIFLSIRHCGHRYNQNYFRLWRTILSGLHVLRFYPIWRWILTGHRRMLMKSIWAEASVQLVTTYLRVWRESLYLLSEKDLGKRQEL